MQASFEKMTVRELREFLEPYGTPYRLSMSRPALQEAAERLTRDQREYGTNEAPLMTPRPIGGPFVACRCGWCNECAQFRRLAESGGSGNG